MSVKKTRDAFTTLRVNIRAGNLGKPGSNTQGKKKLSVDRQPVAIGSSGGRSLAQKLAVDPRRPSRGAEFCRSTVRSG